MKTEFSKDFIKEIRKIKLKNVKLYKRIQKQISLFASHPTHPSLRTHKLSGNLKNYWSISVNKSIRIIYKLMKDKAYFVDIGTHDEVYDRN
jgi:addiction module RelE/StbE family toxin